MFPGTRDVTQKPRIVKPRCRVQLLQSTTGYLLLLLLPSSSLRLVMVQTMSPIPMRVSICQPNKVYGTTNCVSASVAARTLTMPQVGVLSVLTEFAGAVGLGARVTSTVKNGIIDIDHFREPMNPGTLMLAMGCAGT
jgi:hypothetical protein